MFLVKLDSENVVVATYPAMDLMSVPLYTPLDNTYIMTPGRPDIGHVFDAANKTFAVPPRKRWITKLAFDSRFTMNEAVLLKISQNYPTRELEETDEAYNARCALPAQLQVMQSRLNMATYIDLDRADTRYSVQQLEALGLIGLGRATEILDNPIQDHEYYKDA